MTLPMMMLAVLLNGAVVLYAVRRLRGRGAVHAPAPVEVSTERRESLVAFRLLKSFLLTFVFWGCYVSGRHWYLVEKALVEPDVGQCLVGLAQIYALVPMLLFPFMYPLTGNETA